MKCIWIKDERKRQANGNISFVLFPFPCSQLVSILGHCSEKGFKNSF